MTDGYQFVLTDAAEQRRILEQFRLYGTRLDKRHGYPDTTRCVTLWYALRAGEFLLTSVYGEYLSGANRVLQSDIVILGRDCGGLVRCRIPQYFERIGEGGCWHSDTPEIGERFGNVPCKAESLAKMIQFYAEHQLAWERQFSYAERMRMDFQTRRERIQEQPELWQDELLAKEYRFVKLTEQEKARMQECAKGTYPTGRISRFDYAMTDAQKRFLMVQCYFMSDGIKHCGEPDDYAYAIHTGSETGIVYVWHPHIPEIRYTEGSIPIPLEALKEIIRYYDVFHSDWENELRSKEGE